MKKQDLTNQMFGNWLVLYYAGDRKWMCECQCELHTRREVATSTLKSGKSSSCGMCKKLQYDLTNQHFGELKAIKYTGKDNKWLCECSCGAIVEKTSKHLRNGVCKTCGNQHAQNILNKQLKMVPKTQVKQAVTQNKPKYKPAGDWTVLYPTKDGYYMCKCTCGYTKEMSDSAIYNARKNNYQCKHAIQMGTVINNLKVIGRDNNQPAGRQYKCQCLLCGKITYYGSYSLLNNMVNSCGCSKAPTYTKEQVIALIENYKQSHNGSKPQPLELKGILNLGETAAYEYIQRYELQDYVEQHQSLGEKQV